jgi:hypothetical protein
MFETRGGLRHGSVLSPVSFDTVTTENINTRDYWVFGLCPSAVDDGQLKKQNKTLQSQSLYTNVRTF